MTTTFFHFNTHTGGDRPTVHAVVRAAHEDGSKGASLDLYISGDDSHSDQIVTSGHKTPGQAVDHAFAWARARNVRLWIDPIRSFYAMSPDPVEYVTEKG